ncbi:MAG: hypothetical protein ACFB15_28555 [Cyclobacteriaceae bacterium]
MKQFSMTCIAALVMILVSVQCSQDQEVFSTVPQKSALDNNLSGRLISPTATIPGKDLYKGILFADHRVQKQYPALQSIKQIRRDPYLMPNQKDLELMTEIEELLIKIIDRQDATFFDRFARQVQSGDHLAISNALDQAAQMTLEAMSPSSDLIDEEEQALMEKRLNDSGDQLEELIQGELDEEKIAKIAAYFTDEVGLGRDIVVDHDPVLDLIPPSMHSKTTIAINVVAAANIGIVAAVVAYWHFWVSGVGISKEPGFALPAGVEEGTRLSKEMMINAIAEQLAIPIRR